jgi:hypothetical protein
MRKKCVTCGKEFYVRPAKVKSGGGKYCSQKCYWGEKITVSCPICDKSFKTFPSKIKDGRGKYCSRKCFYESQKGILKTPDTAFKKGHTPWNKGDEEFPNTQGYIMKLARDHPKANRHGYVRKARLVAEDILGRFLTNKETVHHINGNEGDDRPENLYLFSSNSEHVTYHLNVRHGNISPISISNLTQ